MVHLRLHPSISPSTFIYFSYSSSLLSLHAIYPCIFMQLHESWGLSDLRKKKNKAFSWLLCGVFVHLCSVWCMIPSPHFCSCEEVIIKPRRDPFCLLLLGYFTAGADSASVCSGLCGDLWLEGLLLAWNTSVGVACSKKMWSYPYFVWGCVSLHCLFCQPDDHFGSNCFFTAELKEIKGCCGFWVFCFLFLVVY